MWSKNEHSCHKCTMVTQQHIYGTYFTVSKNETTKHLPPSIADECSILFIHSPCKLELSCLSFSHKIPVSVYKDENGYLLHMTKKKVLYFY